MEFVGKIVRKVFDGVRVLEGTVESYDSCSGLFKIVYQNGDSEVVDFSGISLLVRSIDDEDGRNPKRQRCMNPGNVEQNLFNLEIGFELGQNVGENVRDNGNLDRVVDGLDLNRGLNLDDEVEFDEENVKKKESFDLNLSVDNECDDNCKGDGELEKRERGFDLNLGFNDEGLVLDPDNETEGKMMDVPVQMRELQVSNSSDNVNKIVCSSGPVAASGSSTEQVVRDACAGSIEEVHNGNGFSTLNKPVIVLALGAGNMYARVPNFQRKKGRVAMTTPGSSEKGNRSRKRSKVVSDLDPTSESGLRRSARRAKAMLLDQSNVSSSIEEDEEAKDWSLSELTEVTQERPDDSDVLPSKVELPSSSTNLDFNGISVIDVFSVYSFLRSFSTFLYLSPFELEDLVAALHSTVANSLIDSIHLSILQALRKHLEFLVNEGSESASVCLRDLNWDLLDLVTWPVYMIEYLLVHGSGLNASFDLVHLKPFDDDYYKQPADVKIELLRCLCDDVIEVEAIRSELSRRTVGADSVMDVDRALGSAAYRKRRNFTDPPGDSCSSDDVYNEAADRNGDECYLCKMDGNLICCDGCPAAYHSKCVGVVSSLLPEGEWHCRECVLDGINCGYKPQKLIRGAELLGFDPYGRLYYGSCGYLLVSDSCDTESLLKYYNRDDVGTVIEVLRSSGNRYGSVLRAISKFWSASTHSNRSKHSLDSGNCALPIRSDVILQPASPAKNCMVKDEEMDERKSEEKSIAEISADQGSEVLKSADLNAATTKCGTEMENPVTSSDGSAEVLQAGTAPDLHVAETNAPGGGALSITPPARKRGRKPRSVAFPQKSSASKENKELLPTESGAGYVNHYRFAQTAFAVAEELTQKSSGKSKKDFTMTEDEIMSVQLEAILKKSAKFCWSIFEDQNVGTWREKCGWCYSCRFPADDRECLFNMKNISSVLGGLKDNLAGLQPKRNRLGHLVDIICQMLSMEDRLRGLLVGPWLGPEYSKFWRTNVLKASDIASVKRQLLTLEFNLHPRAFSTDWWEHVDSALTIGSASHIIVSSRILAKHGVGRKRGKGADHESTSRSGKGGLTMLWWRGGKLSRKLFNWKNLPHSLSLRAARKGGSMKIPGILYPDSQEYARRSKNVAWRAAVESSTNVEQLALQVREFHLNIKWDEIENTQLHSKLDKESKKSIRLFKKVIVRRKCTKGNVVRYLLDFGKRRSVPDVVLKHGCVPEDFSSERKKYWLDESYVPLHLLKTFEEKRIARKAGKMQSSKVLDGDMVVKRPLKRKGFDYLFARAERPENYRCGHCNKDVPMREAVSCQHCGGFFHRRHIVKSSEAIISKSTYTCHKCRASKLGKIVPKGGKGKLHKVVDSKSGKIKRGRGRPRKEKNASASFSQLPPESNEKMKIGWSLRPRKNANLSTGVTLRRSARKTKYKPVQSIKGRRGRKPKQQSKSRDQTTKNNLKGSSWQKKRTQTLPTFWKNGLLLSRKPNDERAVDFKRRKLVIPSEFSADPTDQPKCPLCCEERFTSSLKYIACEICRDWFHGDAFGLDAEDIGSLIGFRCHACRSRSPPLCPHVEGTSGNGTPLSKATTSEAEDEVTQGLLDTVTNSKERNSGTNSLENDRRVSLKVYAVRRSRKASGRRTLS